MIGKLKPADLLLLRLLQLLKPVPGRTCFQIKGEIFSYWLPRAESVASPPVWPDVLTRCT